jgi:predicted nuclease of predicted toxin-antitoxin system
MAKFFADEDFPRPVVEELRRLGHDVVTVKNIGMANRRWPDPKVLQFAISSSRIVLTKNRRHFYKLHQSRSDHFGIVLCTDDPDFQRTATRIHEAIANAGDTRGKLLRVYKP